MKIGIVADAPLITHSCAVVASQLAKQWVKQGHEVHYLGYNYTGDNIEHKDGYTIYTDTFPPTREASVDKFIKDTGVQILYSHGSKDIFGEGMKSAKKAGIPYIPHTFYSTPTKNDKVNTFEARKGFILYDCENTDDMVVCNNFSVGVGFALGKRTWFIPNGVDTDIFKPYVGGNAPRPSRHLMGIPEDAFVFVFSGSNISGKDPGRCLDALSGFIFKMSDKVFKNDAYLVMHTIPVNTHLDLKQLAREKGIEHRVKFFTDYYPKWLELPEADKNYRKGEFSPPYTTTPYERMPDVFTTGDVQLAPTLMEGMSTTILEGMACGLPTICSDDAVVSESVVNFSTGLLCRRLLTNENKTEDMIKHMEYFYNNRDVTRQMGKNAHDLVKVKYSWEVISKQLLYLFQLKLDKYYD